MREVAFFGKRCHLLYIVGLQEQTRQALQCAAADTDTTNMLDVVAVAFAVVAAVDAMVAVVSAAVAAVDAICSPRPTANKLFHHSFALFNVIRENAESLFKVCATCCNPIVIDIRD